MWKYLGLIGLTTITIACGEKAVPQMPPPLVKTYTVESRDIDLYKEYIGEVYGEKDIDIRARVEGFVKAIHFREGLPVKKGQLLYEIESTIYEAKLSQMQSQLAAATTELVHAKNELGRYRPLARQNAVSQSDLDAATATFKAAQSGVKAARANVKAAQINLSYTKVYSPIDGFIGKTIFKVGDLVGSSLTDSKINTVSEISTIRVEFFLPEKRYLNAMRRFVKEKVSLDEGRRRKSRELSLYLSDGSRYEHNGTIEFIDRNVDASTGAIRIQASFPNPDNILRPGLFVRIKGKVETRRDAIAIPQRCIMELQGTFQVAAVDASGTVRVKRVTAAEKLGSFWLISDGLKAGETIIYEGLQKVGNGITVKGEPIAVEFNYMKM